MGVAHRGVRTKLIVCPILTRILLYTSYITMCVCASSRWPSGKSLGLLPKWLGFKALGGYISPPGFGSRFTLFRGGKLPARGLRDPWDESGVTLVVRVVGPGYPDGFQYIHIIHTHIYIYI